MIHRPWLLLIAAVLAVTGPVAVADPIEREAQFYQITEIAIPPNVTFEAGALAFRGKDQLVCATRIGEIWIGEGILAKNPQPKWTRFADGLHEVLGLAIRPNETEGWIYCTQRGEVSRLRDTNKDGRADEFETVSDGWGIDGNYHEYAFGSKFDREGNIWVALCLTDATTSNNPYRGWCLRITPAGEVIPTVVGLRSPGGIGFNAQGDAFYTDNQGNWNGASKLQWLKPGAFVGHPDGLKWFDHPLTNEAVRRAGVPRPTSRPLDRSRLYLEMRKIPSLLPPSVYFPYNKMGQSASGFACDLSQGKFGPFPGQMFVGDHTHSLLMRASLEKVNGHFQGACYPFRTGFSSGVVAVEPAPDGSLIVFGSDRGWGARGGKAFSLERLSWLGKTPFEVQEMKATSNGFDLVFTEPVDRKSAESPASYTAESYTYIYQSAYGSPEVDRRNPTIRTAAVSDDRLRVRLTLSELTEGHVVELNAAGIRSERGEELLHSTAYYTLFQIPKP